MDTKKLDRLFVQRFVDEIQNLNEIGGPDNVAEYIYVMEQVKRAVDSQLETAKSQLLECTSCHKMVPAHSMVWADGDPLGLTPDGGDDDEHPYCDSCIATAAVNGQK